MKIYYLVYVKCQNNYPAYLTDVLFHFFLGLTYLKNSEDSLPKKCSRLGFKTQRSVEVRHQGVNNVVREEADDLNLIQLDSFAEEYGFMKAGTIQKTGNIIFEMIFIII